MPIYVLGVFLDTPSEKQAVEVRVSLTKALATVQPVERPILMLTAIDRWTSGPEGMLNFFFLDKGVFLGEVIDTLDTEGLDAHAALFREARALLGWNEGAPHENNFPLASESGDIADPMLGGKLTDLSKRYRALPNLLEVAGERIAHSTELSTIYESLRAEVPDDLKLEFLAGGLMNCLTSFDTSESWLHSLAELPAPYVQMLAVYVFDVEIQNGSMHQFFFNDSGALAPDVVAALKGMGLAAQADAVQRGIDIFPEPYPRDLETRREFMALQNTAFDETLFRLTDMIDHRALRDALLSDARQAGIVPL